MPRKPRGGSKKSPATKPFVIGLTGSFGSGCSTLRKGLEANAFYGFSLSRIVKQEWRSRNKKKGEPLRSELQEMGNTLRKEANDSGILATKAIEAVQGRGKQIVFDGIRNIGEVSKFRSEYPDFYLVALNCSLPERWERCKSSYKTQKLAYEDFVVDDTRDKDEELDWGQQVSPCVDNADIVLKNEEHFNTLAIAKEKLMKKWRITSTF